MDEQARRQRRKERETKTVEQVGETHPETGGAGGSEADSRGDRRIAAGYERSIRLGAG